MHTRSKKKSPSPSSSGETTQYLLKFPFVKGKPQNTSLDKGRLGGIFGKNKKAFTLVELIIVITILAILATIAFMSFQWYTSKSRDSNRATTAKNIETWLLLFQAQSWVYPIQSTWGTISVWGTGITVQWDLDLSIARVINLNEVPRDPKTGEMYHYISDTKGRGWKVLYYLENTPDYAFLTQSFAESETRIAVVKGQWPWVLLDTGSQMVTKNVDLFGATQSWETFTILVSDSLKIPWTGLELGGGFQNFAEKWGRLEVPKSCPTGFIAVPWNAELMQPWFCVAKYEMGYADDWLAFWDTTWNTIWWGTVHPACTINNPSITNTSGNDCTSQDFVWWNGWIVSKAWKFPIAYLTQHESIQACKSIWWHLITNNEWMTIARDIESNVDNWSSGTVGTGGLYRGITGENSETLWCQTVSSSGSGTYTCIAKTLGSDTMKWWASKWSDCDSKRQLKLSNGEIIWDLAGNVREYVNGRNTITGENFATMQWDVCWWGELWYSWSWTWSCTFTNWYSYEKYGPKTLNLNESNWIWKIRSYKDWWTNRVFFRGGNGGGASTADNMGVFAMNLARISSNQGANVGFRCAF